MLTHLSEGLLRRYLDEPAAVGDTDLAHLSACPRCRKELDRAREDRDAVGRALAAGYVNGGPSDVVVAPEAAPVTTPEVGDARLDRAWVAFRDRLDETESSVAAGGTAAAGFTGPSVRRRPRPMERAVRRPVTAAVTAGLLVVGGTAAAAANDWLPGFRTEKVAPVTVQSSDLAGADAMFSQVQGFAELAAYGDVVAPTAAAPVTVPDAAVAAERTGLDIPEVGTLPTGVEGSPVYQVADQQVIEFTFSAEKAAQAAQAVGATLPPMPDGLDGTRVRIDGGPMVAEMWGQSFGIPTLVVIRAKAPTAATQGASLQTVRDYLLSLPGISDQLASQLRSVTGDGTTLPIPVPADLATSSQADVNGAAATVVQTKDGFGAAVIWAQDGLLNLVLGPLGQDEVLGVARDIH